MLDILYLLVDAPGWWLAQIVASAFPLIWFILVCFVGWFIYGQLKDMGLNKLLRVGVSLIVCLYLTGVFASFVHHLSPALLNTGTLSEP